jgi:beta-lactamase regulating signal transducer with metallopeptidase domain
MTEAILAFVVNAAWQVLVAAVVGLAADRALRSAPARTRCRMLALILAAAVAAPLTSLVPRSAAVTAFGIAARVRLTSTVGYTVTAIYLLGLAVAAWRLARAFRATRRLIRAAAPSGQGFRISDNVASPVTVGRTILLPRAIVAAPDLVAGALAHEEAHVRHRDFLENALLEVIALPLWFHPAAQLLRRRVSELREMACDDEAAARCGARPYAAALVRLASLAAPRLALGMASTTVIERRVERVLRSPRPASAAVALLAAAIVPLALVAGCARYNVSPTVAHSLLCGDWALVAEASDFGALMPNRYDAYTQSIAQGPSRIVVRQHRVANGRAEDHVWSAVTDGAWRPMTGDASSRGRATWRDGRLTLRLESGNGHREDAVAWVSGNRLICDGTTERGRFHAVFQRIDPED